jgi:hypothetical protein
MRSKEAADLVHLSARGAVARFFDSANYRMLRRLMVVATPVALVLLVIAISKGNLWQGLAWVPLLLVTLWIFFTRAGRFFERYGRQMTLCYLALLVAGFALSVPEPQAAYAFAGYVLPALLILFRFKPLEAVGLVGVDAAGMVWCLFRAGMPEGPSTRIGMAVGSAITLAIVLAIAIAVTRRDRESFLVNWRREVARERDSSRMRSELQDARTIQLSMLPVGAPALDWLDFASVSLPASEVGGDYFDYFELPDGKLAIVIGDVAGHGVASGLVLSGVRSCLHLLREELARPVDVLTKLDGMLRATVGGRLFVTFQIAILDPIAGRVTVANAGHPPLLLLSQDRKVTRLGGDSLPMGTKLAPGYLEQSAALEPGDSLLLFSDGVPEIRDIHGEGFGEERLVKELRRVHAQGGARQVRDSLLNALARFKSDVEQEDDLTLVVVKIGDLAASRAVASVGHDPPRT